MDWRSWDLDGPSVRKNIGPNLVISEPTSGSTLTVGIYRTVAPTGSVLRGNAGAWGDGPL